MIKSRKLFIVVVVLLAVTMLAACGSTLPPTAEADTGGSGGSSGGGSASEPTPAPTPLPAGDVQGVLYSGTLAPPQSGIAALYVHDDNRLELLVVEDKDLVISRYMSGELEGKIIGVEAEVGPSKASGRFETGAVEINLTYPGKGYVRVGSDMEEGGRLYTGTVEATGLTAALAILPDGSAFGIAPVSGSGDEAVFEYLCVEGGESMPDEITATTCESGEEFVLTAVN